MIWSFTLPEEDFGTRINVSICEKLDNGEEWINGLGQEHRIDGPSSFYSASDRTVGARLGIQESFKIFGVYHRTDGPASQGWYEGSLYLYGIKFPPKRYNELKDLSPRDMLYSMWNGILDGSFIRYRAPDMADFVRKLPLFFKMHGLEEDARKVIESRVGMGYYDQIVMADEGYSCAYLKEASEKALKSMTPPKPRGLGGACEAGLEADRVDQDKAIIE